MSIMGMGIYKEKAAAVKKYTDMSKCISANLDPLLRRRSYHAKC